MWRFLRALAVPNLSVTILAAAILAVAVNGCVNPAYQKLAAPQAGLGAAASRPVHVSLPSTPQSYFGVFEPAIPNSYRQVAQFARATGSQPNLVLDYTYWGEPFVTAFARRAQEHGATVIVDLDPTGPSVRAIATGSQDGYLEAFAGAVRAFGGPVIISFGHEMNGNWYPWGYTHTSPALFVQAWRHIVTVFRHAGADNVTWLWTINAVPVNGPEIRAWWPGASYVTWAAIDGYVYERYQNFGNVFVPTIAAIRKITAKPILIGETAVGQVAGQAAGIPGLFAGVKRHHLLGLIWFDKAQSGSIYAQDWRLEGNQAAENAVRRAVKQYLELPSAPQPRGGMSAAPQRIS